MKTTASLEETLLQISKAVINIRNLNDFYTTVMENIRPIVQYDDVVLIQLSEDKKTCNHILTMSPDERVAHPNYDEVVTKEFETKETPVEDIIKGSPIDTFLLSEWLKYHPEFPGVKVMRDTNLNYSVSLQLKNNKGVFAILLFHFEKKPDLEKNYAFYEGVKDQLALALGNILANEAIVQEKKFAETLLSISEATTNIRDRDDLYKTIMNQIYPVIKFDDAVVMIFDEELKEHTYILTMSDTDRINHPLYKKVVQNFHSLEQTPGYDVLYEEDCKWYKLSDWLKKYPTYPGLLLMKDTDLNHTLVLQLKKFGNIFGGLLFHFKDIQDEENDVKQKYYSSIANQLSVAISNVLANEAITQEKKFAETLLSISEATTNIRDRDDLYRTIMDKIKPIVNFDDAVTIVLSEDGTQYNHILTVSPERAKKHPNYSSLVNKLMPLDGSPIQVLFKQKEIVRYYNLYDDWLPKYPEYPGFILMKDIDMPHSIILKLVNGGKVFGVLLFHFKEAQPENDYRWKLYPNIADQLSVAISNVLANESILEEKRVKTLLLNITQKVTQIRSIREFLLFIVAEIKPVFKFHNLGIFIISKDGEYHYDLAELYPEIGNSNWDYKLSATGIHNIPHKGSVLEFAINKIDNDENKVVLFDFLHLSKQFPEYHQFKAYSILDDGYRDSLSTNLRVGDKSFGMFCINAKGKDYFNKKDFSLFKSIGEQLSVSLDNILANESILEEKKQKEMLLTISEAATKIRDRETLYHTIMTQIHPIVQYDDAVAVILSDDRTTFQHILTMSPEERKEHPLYDEVVNKPIALKNTPVEQIFANEDFKQYSTEKWMEEFPDFEGVILMMETGLRFSTVLKLKKGSEIYGFVIFHFKEEQDMTSNVVKLYPNIADQLSVAISNVLANEKILEEKRINSILLKITQKVTQIRGLREFLLFVVSEIKPIFKFDNLGVFILSEDSRKHYDIAALYPEICKVDWDFTLKALGVVNIPHKDSLIEYMMEQVDSSEKKVILFDFVDLEEKFPEYDQFINYPIVEEGYRDCLTTNLRVGTNSFGMFCINAKEKNFFKKSEFTLFKSIGEQLSVALDNILTNESVLEEKKQKEMLLTISEAATKIRDRETLYHTIMTQIHPIVQYDDAVAIILSEDKTTFHKIMTMAPKKRRKHPFYDETVNNPLPIVNTPAKQMLLNDDIRQYSVDSWIEEFPDFKGTQLMKQTGLNFTIVLKLKKGNEVYGLVQFHFKDAQSENDYRWKLYPNIADQLSVAISNVLANEQIHDLNEQLTLEKEYLEEEIKTSYNFDSIIGDSQPIQQVFKMVEQVASSNSTVIILGETGTGKELIARAIHDRSPRNERPLIKINCAALPPQLLESELFGHEKGSFTGAVERRLGKFELAHQGTIFLDEIGELPLELQSKLLRVLQEREIERLGGNKVIKIDTRIITATNRNLEQEVKEGNFRADLFFRLNVFPIILPPLRSRTEDIPALAQHFLERKSKNIGKKFKGIAKATINQMKAYHWPGNVRELEHLIERAMITAQGGLLKVNLAQLALNKGDDAPEEQNGFSPKTIKDNERALIIATLKHCGGRVRGTDGAAALLDINPSTLESRMRKLGIKKAFVAEG